jgi:outer membrane protein OmpA-like peptidoglycan-associated protein
VRRPYLVLALLALAGCATKEPAEPAAGPQLFVVYFQTGAATLTPDATQIVATAAAAARERTPSKLIVEGHADGGTTNDAALADQRALAVMAALTGDGVDATAIEKNQGAPAAGVTGVDAHQVTIRLLP